jgi:DNA-binding transcriptional regulator GbsR (MarR family)
VRTKTNLLNLAPTDRQLLGALYPDNPLGVHELADQLSLAAYDVRASLKKLRRERLVEEWLTRRAHEFRISDRGLALVNAERQMELGG